MILYLTSARHTNLLDFTGFYEPDSEMPVKKMVGCFVLKQFVIYDMRNFSHITDVVLDRSAFTDSDEVFVQAIEEFLTMYSARITVICEGLSEQDALFQDLLDRGVGNLVRDTDIRGIQQEIRECLSDRGMNRYASKPRSDRPEAQEHYHFACNNVAVAVAGAQPRTGTTTAAVGLCTWLAHAGASVCYVEANKSGHLPVLARSYGMEPQKNGWMFEGVLYQTEAPEEDVNFVVYDLGSSFTDSHDILERSALKILVCGTKPHELGFTIRLQNACSGTRVYLYCPFVADEMRDELAEALQNDYHKVLFAGYQPELTDGNCNAKQYKSVMAKYITGA